MAKLIYELQGVRGREMKLYDTKCVITTKKTAGSLLTGNFTDGEKTIFLCDVVGIQFKESGGLIGYLQFETSSMQMNNKDNNMFSENTFTFEDGKNGVSNYLMREVYAYVVDRIEELKYGSIPCFNAQNQTSVVNTSVNTEPAVHQEAPPNNNLEPKETATIAEATNFIETEKGTIVCSHCKTEQNAGRRVCWNCGAKFIQ